MEGLEHVKGVKDMRDRLKRHATKIFPLRPLKRITHLTIHHSLTKQGSAESYARYHVQQNGWPGIGYHFVIEKDGAIKWCNDLTRKTYHVGKSNGYTVGVCLTGDFRSQKPTDAQWTSLYRITRWLMDKLDIPEENVQGHSEFPGYSWKECPCLDMADIRKRLPLAKSTGTTTRPQDRVVSGTVMPGKKVPKAQVLGQFNYVDWDTMKRLNPDKQTDTLEPGTKLVTCDTAPKPLPKKESDSIARVIDRMRQLGHTVFTRDARPLNLNLVGIRSGNREPNRFDDQLAVFWKHDGSWTLKTYRITTDPGLYWLQNPSNTHGTAILKEGQYRGAYQIGKHRDKYKALVQRGPVTVIRDFDRDGRLDMNGGKEQTGLFGINIHRSNREVESKQVDRWSAGCQVFANPHEFSEFMKLCTQASLEWGNSFTYSLISFRNGGLLR